MYLSVNACDKRDYAHISVSTGSPEWGFPVVKNLPANAGDARDKDLIPGSGRSPEVGNGSPLQYLAGYSP